jgi:hypothetical protein
MVFWVVYSLIKASNLPHPVASSPLTFGDIIDFLPTPGSGGFGGVLAIIGVKPHLI